MLSLSILQILLIAILIFIKLTGQLFDLYNFILISICICALILFFLGYPIFRSLFHILKIHTNSEIFVRSHFLLLHFIIFAFIVLDQFYGVDYKTMLTFSPYIILFFLTAVITWRSCYSVFKSKIYKFFSLGSTALLVWSTVLTLLGLLYRENFLTEKLHFLSLCYFTLHFAEFGFVLLKIKKDLESINSLIPQSQE